jgi:hypothetical protein
MISGISFIKRAKLTRRCGFFDIAFRGALVFVLSFFFLNATALRAAVQLDVRKTFAAGKKDYEQNRLSEAAKQFQGIVNKFPDHEPSLIFLGKIHYRDKKYQEAGKYFSRVSPKGQDPETLFEMGMTYTQLGLYREGIACLEAVPAGHQSYDLANFYAGRSALRLKQYEKARSLLRNATILPDTLAEQRKIYLEHVQKVFDLREKAALERDLAQEKSKASKGTATQPSGPPDKPATTTQPDTTSDSKSPLPKLGPSPGLSLRTKEIYKIEKTTNIFMAREHQDIQYKLGRSQVYDASIFGIQVRNGPSHNFKSQADGRKGRVALDLDLRGDQQVRTGRLERVLVVEESSDLEYYISDNPEKKREQFGRVDLKPVLELPLLHQAMLGLHGGFSYVFPNFDKRRGAGTRELGIKAKVWTGPLEFLGGFDFREALDAENDRILNFYETSLHAFWFPADDLELSLKGSYGLYQYFLPSLDGPDEFLRIGLIGKWLLPLGFELGGRMESAQLKNYVYHGVSRGKEIRADGVNFSGQAFVRAMPFPFAGFEMDYTISDNDWSMISVDEQVEFFANVPLTQGLWVIKGMLILDF